MSVAPACESERESKTVTAPFNIVNSGWGSDTGHYHDWKEAQRYNNRQWWYIWRGPTPGTTSMPTVETCPLRGRWHGGGVPETGSHKVGNGEPFSDDQTSQLACFLVRLMEETREIANIWDFACQQNNKQNRFLSKQPLKWKFEMRIAEKC